MSTTDREGEEPTPAAALEVAGDEVRQTPAGTSLATPSSDRVLAAVLHLSRIVSVEMRDEDLVHAYVDVLKDLFPRRLFAIRLVSPTTGKLALAYATERLREEHLRATAVSRQAIERHKISPDLTPHRGIRIVDTYSPLIQNSTGFDVPMMDGDRMVGVLSVDYPPGITEFADDHPVIMQLAVLLGAALRNARLLRESVYLRDYLSKLLENATAPVVVLGKNRQVRVVNRAFLSLTDLERSDVLGVDFLELVIGEEQALLQNWLADASSGSAAASMEVGVLQRSGAVARFALNAVAIQSPEGEAEGLLVIGRDLTEMRRLEARIVHAEKLATLGQIAAGVVHELNNPLTSIAVYSEYLLKKLDGAGLPAPDVEKLRRIALGADRIRRFTRDLTAYARPAQEPAQWVAPHALLDQSIVFCEPAIAECGTGIDQRYPSDLPEIWAVREQLHQVFINLITNACHAMPEGAGHLIVEAWPTDTDVRFRVTDNGVGIPPDVIHRVFEPFFSTKGEGKGTGLGLSIARNIVQEHRGEITVVSEVGRGTTFEIHIPRRPQQ